MDDYTRELLDYRQRKDAFFKTPNSPLPPQWRADFGGLSYYQPDPAYRVTARLERGQGEDGAGGEDTELATSSGELRPYARYGRAHVVLPAGAATLELYAAPGEEAPTQLFVPFRDATSGAETYGAGRYLEAPLHADLVMLDFNLAYHPYCAYAEGWSCPLPPPANWLAFPVRAGERNAP